MAAPRARLGVGLGLSQPAARFASFVLGAAGVDLLELGAGRPSCAIYADGACTLVISPATGRPPASVPFRAGTRHALEAVRVGGTDDGSTPAGVRVFVSFPP